MDTVFVVGVDSLLTLPTGEPAAAAWASWAAIVIAVAALGLSIWQGWQIRVHNRKSVTPHVAVRRALGGVANEVGLQLQNKGLGPAVIRKHILSINGKDFNACTAEVWDAVREAGLMDPEVSVGGKEVGDVLAAGEEFWVIFSDAGNVKHAEMISRIKATVHYSSLYGENYVAVADPMDWDAIRQRTDPRV